MSNTMSLGRLIERLIEGSKGYGQFLSKDEVRKQIVDLVEILPELFLMSRPEGHLQTMFKCHKNIDMSGQRVFDKIKQNIMARDRAASNDQRQSAF
jgi:hypothetical protein